MVGAWVGCSGAGGWNAILMSGDDYECAERLTELLGQHVELAPDSIGEEVEAKKAALKVRVFSHFFVVYC
jgi:hypothetical protein